MSTRAYQAPVSTKASGNDSELVQVAIVMATNSFAGAFADADQCVGWVCRRWLLTLAKVFVDEVVEQRSKTQAATLCFVAKSPVLLGVECNLSA